MQWFRLYSETIDDEKLRLLAFEDRWHFIAILCLKSSGILDGPYSKDMVRRKTCIKLGIQLTELDEIARRLSDVGLIDPKTLQPLAWNSRQYISDNSTERVRKYRKTKETGNVSETLPKRHGNGPDTESDTEAEAETENNKTPMSKPSFDACPIQEIINHYHEVLHELPKVVKRTKTRDGYIRQRWREDLPTVDQWRNFFLFVRQSDFLMGKSQPRNGGPPFIASLEWLTRPSNFAKIAEDKYHGQVRQQPQPH